MRFQLLATLACSAALLSFDANATKSADATFHGGYVIEVLPSNTADHSNPKCMIFDPAQGSTGVRLHRGTGSGLCGRACRMRTARPGSIWDIAPVKHTDGRQAYVIRSRVNGKCLIRGWSGTMVVPNLHEWNANNPPLCGWDSEDALIDNGQAAWVFGASPDDGNLAYGIAVLRNGLGYLSFASSNATLKESQAMIAVDHVFRFHRVPDPCPINGAVGSKEIIRVCGVGDFAQPVRVENANYLNVIFEAWSATDGYGMGDSSKQYMAVWPVDAYMYCYNLRTGSYDDWRLPTLDELRSLYNAFPDNQLLTKFGWTTGYRGHLTGSGYETPDGKRYFYTVVLHDGRVAAMLDTNPFPISCIR